MHSPPAPREGSAQPGEGLSIKNAHANKPQDTPPSTPPTLTSSSHCPKATTAQHPAGPRRTTRVHKKSGPIEAVRSSANKQSQTYGASLKNSPPAPGGRGRRSRGRAVRPEHKTGLTPDIRPCTDTELKGPLLACYTPRPRQRGGCRRSRGRGVRSEHKT